MKISKTRFINYMRCDRFPSLDSIRREKEQAVVSFLETPDLEELMSEENKYKKKALIDDMYDEDTDEDLLEKIDEQMEVMLPYYNQIEVVAGQIIQKKFKGNVVYALDTYHQKRFEFEDDGFYFYCFLDGYQEDEDVIRIFEVKATTSKKFVELTYQTEDKEKLPLFDTSPEGIYMLQEDLKNPLGKKYHEKIGKLMQRLDKVGRYVYDLSYQRFVLEEALKTTKKVKYYLVVLNSDYIHDGKVNHKNEPIYGDDIISFFDMTTLTKKMLPVIKNDQNTVVKRLDNMYANPVPLGPHCQRKDSRQCIFYDICYAHIPEKNSVFSYINGHHGFKDEKGEKHERFDMINEGIIHALDVPDTWLERKSNQIQKQVMTTKVPYYDYKKIKRAVASLNYPIYHLDFETFPCPLPRFYGEKPYAQSLFQFSIHIEHEPGVCDKEKDNYSFIATKHIDLRRELILAMLDVIKPDGGSIMVYNMSFEKTRLKEMAEIYPEYRERLIDMMDRLVDLWYFLKGNKKLFESLGFESDKESVFNFYHDALNGSFSIKKVLPIFTTLTYQGMPIPNGVQAIVCYAKFPFMDAKTFNHQYQALKAYCQQDTWAMVEILKSLRTL